jgi:hypothetical protein
MTTDTKLAPTDAEIDAIVYEHTGFDGDGTQPMTADEMRRVTRAVLAKWGAQPVPAWYALVPVEPSAEMVDAAQEAYMPFGDMQLAIQLAIAAAPQPSPTAQAASSAVLKAIREANMQLVRTGPR